MTEKQKATVDRLVKNMGGEVQEGLENCVWVMGRCLLVDQDGNVEEL